MVLPKKESLSSDFPELVSHLGANFKTLIETNGDYLSQPGYIDAIAQNAHRIRVSVDAGNNETRRLTNRPEDSNHTYDQLVKNIGLLRRKTDESIDRDSGLLIGASFIYGPQNYLLVGKFLQDMSDNGVNWVQVKPALIAGKHIDDQKIEEFVLEQLERVRSKSPKGTVLYLPNRVSGLLNFAVLYSQIHYCPYVTLLEILKFHSHKSVHWRVARDLLKSYYFLITENTRSVWYKIPLQKVVDTV